MLYKFLFNPIVAILLGVSLSPAALAQNSVNGTTSSGDSVLLEMNQAFKRGDRKKLTQLLPQARGHALEPWAGYWELKARLG